MNEEKGITQKLREVQILDIPPKVDRQVLFIRVVAALFTSLGVSLATSANFRQTASHACAAIGVVLLGLATDMRGRYRRTRRYDPTIKNDDERKI